MRDIVWEPEWRYTGIPSVGDYIQIQCWCSKLDEGFVMGVVSDGPYVIVQLDGSLVCPNKSMNCWRKGALPEFSTAGMRKTADA